MEEPFSSNTRFFLKVQLLENPFKSTFPKLPAEFKEHPPTILQALDDARECTSDSTERYALSALCLNGKGQITTTDGHQLLVQNGFEFGWEGEALVPSCRVFGCKELLSDQPVFIGKTEQHFALSTGPWTIVLPLVEGRFPRVNDLIANCATAKSVVDLHPSDAEFLAGRLSKLPCPATEFNNPITLDLNGQVSIRAKGDTDSNPTELVLTNSVKSGEDVSIAMNRTFLARALNLGFRKVHCFGEESPIICQDQQRTYLWMILSKDGILAPSEDSVRIESPIQSAATSTVSISTSTTSTRSHPRMRTRARFQPPQAPVQSPPTSPPVQNPPVQDPQIHAPSVSTEHESTAPSGSVVEQAIQLRDSLRVALDRSSALVRTIKKQRRSERVLRETLASLKHLQNVA